MKFILSILLLLICSTAQAATTYYVRSAGGTSDQCTGTTDADYSGTGLAQACAFNHPSWAIGAGGTAKMVGGDTLIISNNTSYMIGYGMPNCVGCSLSFPYASILNNPPSGPDPQHMTKIYGSAYNTGCATKTELWGTNSVYQIFDLTGKSNIDMRCLEITDHSNCGFRMGGNPCSETYNGSSPGTYGRDGIRAVGGNNFYFENLDVHGMSGNGLHIGGINGITMRHVDLTGDHLANWDGDVGESGNTSSFAGNVVLDHMRVRFSGCREAYPRSGSFTTADYTDCTVKADNGYGDGSGFYVTGGNWIVTNSEWSHNSSDGLDLLYKLDSTDLSVDKCLFEGNAGNQLKFTAKNVNVTNSVFVANCTYFTDTGKAYNNSTFETCRANGSPLSTRPGLGSNWKFYNNPAYTSTGSGGSPFLEIIDGTGTCNGTETYAYKNNVLVSNNSITNWVPYYDGLSGACRTAFEAATTTYSDVYNFQSNPAGTGNVFTDPKFVGSIANTASSNLSNVYLQVTSPAKGSASAVTVWNTTADYNNFPQNSPIDMGALQYGSVSTLAQSGQACIATSDCASGTCSNYACTGSCTANAGGCATGATCCSGYCNGSSQCATAPTCGDNVIQPGEVCDGTNMNGSNCTLQGFTGGSLACNANCLGYNTSSCTNTTVFPLTPILDSFTRANSSGLGSNWGNLSGQMNISSNAALPTSGAGGSDKYYWIPSTFLADEEVYVTISNKGSNGDDVKLYFRYDPVAGKGYKLEPDVAGGVIRLFRQDPANTQLGADISQAFSSGDSVGMSASGSTITVYYKASGGSWASKGTRTDTTYATGGNVLLGATGGGGATPDIKFTNFGGGSLNPITCGNNLKEGTEICDGTDLGGQTCTTQGFASGTLACTSHCQSFDTSSCTSASTCGNNTKETGETCDGTDLNSATCTTLGFTSGTLHCNANCLTFNTTGCVSSLSGVKAGVTLK